MRRKWAEPLEPPGGRTERRPRAGLLFPPRCRELDDALEAEPDLAGLGEGLGVHVAQGAPNGGASQRAGALSGVQWHLGELISVVAGPGLRMRSHPWSLSSSVSASTMPGCCGHSSSTRRT